MAYKADSIFKNQFFNMAMQVLNLLFPILAIPYTTRLFGPEILGEVNFANSVVQYFVLIAAAGIPTYATREIAKARDDTKTLRKKFKELAILQIVFTLFSLLIYLILILSIERFRSYIYIYIFLGLQVLSYAFNFVWFLQGVEKYKYAAISTFISKLINIILIFTLLKKREDFYIYAFIVGITLIINAGINMFCSFDLLKNFKSEENLNINYNSIKSHIYSIMVFFLSNVAIKVYTAMDQTMLGILDSSESVAYYSMSIRLEKVVVSLITSMAIVMIPRISNSIKNNKLEDVKKYVSISINIVYLIAIPAIFGVLAIGEEIITIFLGKEFLQSIGVFKLVSSLFIIIGLSNIFGMQIMIPYGKEKKFTIILSVAAVLNFIVNLILIPKLSYYGATLATIFAELVVTVWMYFEVKKILGSLPEVFKVSKILIPSIVFYFVIKLGIKSIFTSDILIILTSTPVAGIIYVIGLIAMKEPMIMSGIDIIKDRIKEKQAA